ncbi:MAG: tRNA uridine-5-carboxymethylaminomethyl(34) synthesis GTPase MnmE, partial [Desulfobacterales bacterium CG23_combo_of_CG06-09_8_20_14_all_52_9]
VLSRGARLADPGEFTKRAFLNGRIDLSQAEAVIDIVNAKTLVSLEIAAAQIHGGLRKKIETCRFALWELQTELSAAIDFPEEMETLFKAETAADRLKGQILSPLQELIKQHDQGRILREGIRVVVAGFPNVGKSSLMNCLLHRDRAIVSPYPGTTRDFLEEPLDLYGLQAMIVDTAGLQETDDPVERIGIEKTHEKIREADLLLFMVDVTQPIFIQKETIPVFEKPTILVVNKVDRVNSDRFPEIPKEWKRFPVVRISALTQYGVDALKEKIFERITQGKGFRQEDPIVPNLRQKLLLDRALKATEAALEGISYGRSPELVSMDVEEALDALNEILGETIRPDILDAIFSRFCIGK